MKVCHTSVAGRASACPPHLSCRNRNSEMADHYRSVKVCHTSVAGRASACPPLCTAQPAAHAGRGRPQPCNGTKATDRSRCSEPKDRTAIDKRLGCSGGRGWSCRDLPSSLPQTSSLAVLARFPCSVPDSSTPHATPIDLSQSMVEVRPGLVVLCMAVVPSE